MILPEVSIILATYNRGHLIIETLQSIKNQSFRNFECLIIDDGGIDNTKNIVYNFINSDNRFSYHVRTNNYNKGLPGCRNYGLDICHGKYVVFFDDDDFVHPENFDLNLGVLENPDFDFCVYQKKPFTKLPEKFKHSEIKLLGKVTSNQIIDILQNKLPMASCTVFWRKSCFRNHRFLESLHYAEEWELYTRMVNSGLKGAVIANVLYYNRKHTESKTSMYYKRNFLMRKSKAEAIVSLWTHFSEGNLFNFKIKRFLINLSFQFSDFDIFNEMLRTSNTSKILTFVWRFYYHTHPFRLFFYQLRRKKEILI